MPNYHFAKLLKHPVFIVFITFLLTGIGASLFSNWLDSNSKKRDLEIAATRRAIESVKSVTDLIFERDTRANFVISSLTRNGPIDELKDRKKAYDEIFIRYNATIQSNLFRIREIFHTADYTDFEKLLEGPLRDLFIAEDQCLTSAYDIASRNLEINDSAELRNKISSSISNCAGKDPGTTTSFKAIHQAILHCEYTYSDALFRLVERSDKDPTVLQTTNATVLSACQFPKLN